MNIPNLRPAREDEFDFAFEAKRQAMGPHIMAKWGWNEELQLAHHKSRWEEKPWSIIVVDNTAIGTVSLDWRAEYLQFGEFYIFDAYRAQGFGTRVIQATLVEADRRRIETRLEYLKWNPVASLYLRHGFRVVGENDIHFFAVRAVTGQRPNNSFKPTPLRGAA